MAARRRHLSRQLALQVLYAHSYHPGRLDELVDTLAAANTASRKNWTPFCRDLSQKTLENSEELDEAIQTALENWRLERLSRVDHVLLRLALCEMRFFDDIPLRVTLNEYIDLAKHFGTEDSSSFVNGILDRLSRDFTHKDFAQEDFGATAEAMDDSRDGET